MMLSLNKPQNEPLINYSGDDKEWQAFEAALENLPQKLDIPMYIGDQKIYLDEKTPSISPIDKEVICTAQKGLAEHGLAAAKAALEAKKEWSQVPAEHRILKFMDLTEILYERRHELCAAASRECGYIAMESSGGWAELMDFMRFNAYYYHQLHQLKLGHGDGETNMMRLRPLKGFTAAITPFNFPIAIGFNLPLVMMLCGNTVVWKPSDDAMLVSWIMMESLKEAGFPSGVVNMVTGYGPDLMKPILQHPELTALNFTGSFATAKKLATAVNSEEVERPHFPRFVAETGGKDFMVVDKKADLYDVASCIISGAFGRSGQKCSANSLVFAHKDNWKELKEQLVNQMGSFQFGNPLERACHTGPVINEVAFNKITGFISRAKENSDCEVFHGGGFDSSKGFYVEPTFIEVKKFPNELLNTEIFGPVVAFYIYDDIADVLEVLDSNTYRLTGAIWSSDESWLTKYVPVFSNYAGNFYVNRKTTAAIVDQQPFGGDGASGTNYKAGGEWYLLQFLSQGTITRRHLRNRSYQNAWGWHS